MDDLIRRRELGDARWLALVPLSVALVLGLLLIPRRAIPEAIPLPISDTRELARVVAFDHELAQEARNTLLPGPVRALGSAIRDFHSLETQDTDVRAFGEAKRHVDLALIDALQEGTHALLGLRAVQLEAFLEEVQRFTASGEQSAELQALAGGFVRSMKSEGWCEGHTLVPEKPVLRTMFKQMWNAFLGLDGKADIDLTLDEQRTLYAFYLSHPHPSKGMREALASARRGARDANACRAIVEAERVADASWLLERIARLAAMDPAYPADYARGVASFRRGDFGGSAAGFRRWLEAHPNGPLVLRVQNYLRAAADADRSE